MTPAVPCNMKTHGFSKTKSCPGSRAASRRTGPLHREPRSTIATLKALLRSSSCGTPPAVGRSWRDREIGRLLETADAGDVLVAAEVSRLARSTLPSAGVAAGGRRARRDGAHRQESDGARPIVAGHDNRNDPWARGADRAGIYLGQDERGARAPQSSGTARRSTERPSHSPSGVSSGG